MSIDGQMIQPASVVPTIIWSPSPAARYALNGPTMGTRYSAVFIAPDFLDTAPIAAALQSAVDATDQQMSNWKPTSDISRINEAEVGTWHKVAPNTIAVVETGLEIGRRSRGAFNIAVGAAVNAWGFGSHGAYAEPLAIARSTGVQPAALLDIDRDKARMRKSAPAQLDLCGIAKGFGVDELARVLESFAITNYLVSIDGELRGSGLRLDGSPWRVAIERPDLDERTPALVIALDNSAIASSGDYRHRHVVDGRIVSHTIDPKTGRPVENGLASVSVKAATCMLADAWATALLVAGPILGPEMAEANGLTALFILRQDNELLELAVGAFG